MQTSTIDNAIKNFKNIFTQVLSNSEEALIVSDNGSVVIINKDDWESIQETLSLLKDKKSLRALLNGHKARDNNKKLKSKSVEKIFSDL